MKTEGDFLPLKFKGGFSKMKSKYKNLKKLNRIRLIAQTVNNQNFQLEYRKIIFPIIDKYKKRINYDYEMKIEIRNAIRKIKRLAKNQQYVPNNPPRPNRKNYKKPDFSQHSKLYRLEKVCEQELIN